MRAVWIRELGPADRHAVEEVPSPVAGSGEVVVDIKAAAVNYPDLLVITGRYQVVPPMPFAPGKDAAGIVHSVGTGVTRVKPGDRVLLQLEYGAYATQALARETQCLPLPPEMGYADAVSLGLAAQTAWFALMERGRFEAGETVLVNGATGAVGLAAVQIARALGATVLAGISSPARADDMLKAGAHHVIDFSEPDLRISLRGQVLKATGGKGADVVIDALGGDIFDASLRALAWCGRIVVIGFAAGRIPEIKANYLLLKNIAASGLQWSDYRDREPWKIAHAHKALVRLWQQGALRPNIMRSIALDDFAQALRLIETRSATGRLVLAME
jgi:NADPH2:quinone reductase